MSMSFLFPVVALPTVNFQEALAQNQASGMNNLQMPTPMRGRDFLIRAIRVLAPDNFGPEFQFFASAAGLTNLVASDTNIARFGFVGAMADRIAAAGLWRYYVDGLAIPYFDADSVSTPNAGNLHVVLQNIDVVAKTAGGAPGGNIAVTFWLEPMTAY